MVWAIRFGAQTPVFSRSLEVQYTEGARKHRAESSWSCHAFVDAPCQLLSCQGVHHILRHCGSALFSMMARQQSTGKEDLHGKQKG